jgi:hypothetical protein
VICRFRKCSPSGSCLSDSSALSTPDASICTQFLKNAFCNQFPPRPPSCYVGRHFVAAQYPLQQSNKNVPCVPAHSHVAITRTLVSPYYIRVHAYCRLVNTSRSLRSARRRRQTRAVAVRLRWYFPRRRKSGLLERGWRGRRRCRRRGRGTFGGR